MSSDPDCVFCKIIAGDIPSFKLYEDDDTLAFMDINPAHEGHALVIPKQHYPDVHSVSDAALTATVLTAKKVAAAVDRTLHPGGLNLLQCNGPAAAQSVMHFHMHVLPRSAGDELRLNWGLEAGDMDAIGALAERIRGNF
jgi:histidine triad (HIT) family protein